MSHRTKVWAVIGGAVLFVIVVIAALDVSIVVDLPAATETPR